MMKNFKETFSPKETAFLYQGRCGIGQGPKPPRLWKFSISTSPHSTSLVPSGKQSKFRQIAWFDGEMVFFFVVAVVVDSKKKINIFVNL